MFYRKSEKSNEGEKNRKSTLTKLQNIDRQRERQYGFGFADEFGDSGGGFGED